MCALIIIKSAVKFWQRSVAINARCSLVVPCGATVAFRPRDQTKSAARNPHAPIAWILRTTTENFNFFSPNFFNCKAKSVDFSEPIQAESDLCSV